MSASRQLYDLVGRDDRRMSPFCWRAKLSLAHKGLDAEIIPIKFTEKDRIAFSGQEFVPVLVDGETTQFDSWRIACYLDDAYPDAATLFGTSGARGTARVLNHWFDADVVMSLFPMLVPDNYDVVLPEDMEYYVLSRENWLGKTRAELEAERSEEKLVAWRQNLEPVRAVLREQAYLGGDAPLYSDYIVFSMFMWRGRSARGRSSDPKTNCIHGVKACSGSTMGWQEIVRVTTTSPHTGS